MTNMKTLTERLRSSAKLVALLYLFLASGSANARTEFPEDGDAGWEEADESVDWDDEESFAPDPTKGIVSGRVVSGQSGDPLIDAAVQVIGTEITAYTDLDGRYEIRLPPGTWELRVWHELHRPERVQDVVVEAGEVQVVDIALRGDDDAVLEVVVEAEADRSRAAVQMERRKRAPVVMDAVSGEEMSRTPDSSAADAMKRVVGASVVDGKYMVVRGFGGRYNSTLLHNVAVPSPEPDLPAVPLDLFPASMLASMSVAKTATPDLPADFAGGILLLDTRQYPNDFDFRLRLSLSGDSVSTFRQAPRGPSGGMDWLGFDDGSRGLPSVLPSDGPASRERLDAEERARIGRAFRNAWGTNDDRIPANLGVSGSVGDTVHLFGRRLGYLASASWGQSWDVEEKSSIEPTVDGGITEDVVELAAIRKVKLGGLGALSYELSPSDEISFVTLFSRNVDDRTQLVTGDTANDKDLEQTQLAYIARQIVFNQLRGHHRVASLGGLELDWQANLSRVDREEPDTRTISYQRRDDSLRLIKERSGQIVSTDLLDETVGAGLDLTLPLGRVRPKVGALYSRSTRDYQTRRFVFDAKRAPPSVLELPPDRIFSDETIGTAFQFEERTRFSDSYTAEQELLAAYGLVDLTVLEPLRLVAGARFERARTLLEPGSPYATVRDEIVGVDRTESDVLPSVNVVYALGPNVNLRGAWAMTVARPQLRELAATSYYDFSRRRNVSGNPELERSLIHNVDLRLEFFPGTTEVLAISLFGKRIDGPIEEVIFSDGGSVQPRNAERGYVYGLELESRVGLHHLSDALREFGITANFTLLHSEVEMAPADRKLMTHAVRPLHGQSPYSVNLGLLYESELTGTVVQLLYNVFGPRLDAVGINGLDDVYEDTFHRLDLAVNQSIAEGWELKLSATNLLDEEEVFRQGDTQTSRFRPGIGASVSLAWHY